MPIGILHQGFTEGLDSIPYGWPIVKVASVFGVLYLLKWFFNGASNTSERNMHSKVVMVTVGSSNIDSANKLIGGRVEQPA
jgi:hypothetical protein